MGRIFESVLSNGQVVRGYPLREGTNAKLIHPDKVIVSLPRLFIFLTSNDQENGMISLKKEAGFTIVANDKSVGVTTQDVIEQVPRIIKLVLQNPEVFDARPWSKYENLAIYDIWSSGIGHFELFITS